jgi:hypothetical protein
VGQTISLYAVDIFGTIATAIAWSIKVSYEVHVLREVALWTGPEKGFLL